MMKLAILTIVLSFSLTSKVAVTEWVQHSSYPTITYGSSPAVQSVGSLQYFTQTFWAGDYDQYHNIANVDEVVQIENTNLNMDIEITSGTLISTNNAHENGKTTVTRVVKSVFCDPALPATREYIDVMRVYDLQTGVVKDTNSIQTTNTVTQKGFPQAGGGEGG